LRRKQKTVSFVFMQQAALLSLNAGRLAAAPLLALNLGLLLLRPARR
jgi:hypothetical protein